MGSVFYSNGYVGATPFLCVSRYVVSGRSQQDFSVIRVKSEDNGRSIVIDFRENDFYSSYYSGKDSVSSDNDASTIHNIKSWRKVCIKMQYLF